MVGFCMLPPIGTSRADDKDELWGQASPMPETEMDSVDVGDWYQAVSLPGDLALYERLPRNGDFKYEYFGGNIHVSPRPKVFQAVLPLTPREAPKEVDAQDRLTFRPLQERDWPGVTRLFGPAFHQAQPFASLNDEERERAGAALIGNLRAGGEGPIVSPACYVAETVPSARWNRGVDLVGALLVTLYPNEGEARSWRYHRWAEPPPPDAIERNLGRPHLTWIFVAPLLMGHGAGSAMLAYAVNALLALGYKELDSSFSLGNPRSAMWHWRNGFQLREHLGSLRAMRRLIARSEPSDPGGP